MISKIVRNSILKFTFFENLLNSFFSAHPSEISHSDLVFKKIDSFFIYLEFLGELSGGLRPRFYIFLISYLIFFFAKFDI